MENNWEESLRSQLREQARLDEWYKTNPTNPYGIGKGRVSEVAAKNTANRRANMISSYNPEQIFNVTSSLGLKQKDIQHHVNSSIRRRDLFKNTLSQYSSFSGIGNSINSNISWFDNKVTPKTPKLKNSEKVKYKYNRPEKTHTTSSDRVLEQLRQTREFKRNGKIEGNQRFLPYTTDQLLNKNLSREEQSSVLKRNASILRHNSRLDRQEYNATQKQLESLFKVAPVSLNDLENRRAESRITPSKNKGSSNNPKKEQALKNRKVLNKNKKESNLWFNNEWGSVVDQGDTATGLSSKANSRSSGYKQDLKNQRTTETRNKLKKLSPEERRERLNNKLNKQHKKDLESKLKGVTDNSERFRLVDKHMSEREGISNKRVRISDTKALPNNSDNGAKFSPYTGNKSAAGDGSKIARGVSVKGTSPLTLGEKFKIALDKDTGIFKDTWNSFIKNRAESLNDPRKDAITAHLLGTELKETVGGKTRGLVNKGLSALGFDVGSSDKLVEYKGVNRITGASMDITHLGDMTEKEQAFWKQMHREETLKHVRKIGGFADPFSTQTFNNTSNMGPVKPPSIEDIDNQLKTITGRLDESKNNFKQFFNPIDKQEVNQLESARQELLERKRRLNLGYGGDHISTQNVMPDSVKASFSDLYDRRARLMDSIKNMNPNDMHTASWYNGVKTELDGINKKLASEKLDNKPIISSASMGTPDVIKNTYKPTFGFTGYGLGVKNSIAASRSEHAARAAHFLTGTGGLQAIKESFGIMNKQQKEIAKTARGFGKLTANIVPLAALGFIGSGMAADENPYKMFTDQMAMAGGLQGWRIGAAAGGALTSGKFMRGAGLLVGGIAGAATGYLATTAVFGGVADIMSNDSSIRKIAKKISTKERTAVMPETRQTLTIRQANLQKLARSGLNDRNTLLGNEASILVR